MFTIRADDSFDWPVTIQQPQNGEYVEHSFMAKFKITPQGRVNELWTDGPVSTGSVRILEECLLEVWDVPIKEANGDEVTDNARKIEILLSIPYCVRGLSDAFASGNAGHEVKT